MTASAADLETRPLPSFPGDLGKVSTGMARPPGQAPEGNRWKRWDIILHMAVWTENIVERMRTGEDAHPAEGAWPPPAVPDEAEWFEAQRRLWGALWTLRDYIETHSLDALTGSPYGLGDLFCRFIHNADRIGQITKMRELRAAPGATK